MPTFLSAPRAYLNFALKLRGFLRHTVKIEEIKTKFIEQSANREGTFLQTLKTNVFDYPRSPYLPLFNQANLTYSDVEKMVKQQGLDQTLDSLYDAGIYVTFEEFKGRVPLKRGNVELKLDASDFDMLNLNPIMIGQTGGSTGQPTRTKLDLDYVTQMAKEVALIYDINGVLDSPKFMWFGLLPDTTGALVIFINAHINRAVSRWYSPIRSNGASAGWYYIMLTYIMIILEWFHGLKTPLPEYVPLDQPLEIATALAETVQKNGSVCFHAQTSKCVRVAVIAQQKDIDLSGVMFYGGGEPITFAKMTTIENSGAKFITHYASTETGSIGLACSNPTSIDDVHFMHNSLAIIQHPKQVLDQTVNTFHFTSILPTNPKMLINVQLDDFGIIEERDCGCPLHQMGFSTHIRKMSSFSKLTGEGVTLVGSDMIHILEHVLPAQFGGSLLDYQLVEEETPDGFTKLVLYVDPSVPVNDESVLLEAFLNALKNSMPSARLAEPEYRTGNVVMIERKKPFVTSRGKHFPIRTLNLARKE
jgi:phenylacetate-coenzyme A ligase PaaK-like adenylate-forming protein